MKGLVELVTLLLLVLLLLFGAVLFVIFGEVWLVPLVWFGLVLFWAGANGPAPVRLVKFSSGIGMSLTPGNRGKFGGMGKVPLGKTGQFGGRTTVPEGKTGQFGGRGDNPGTKIGH